MALQYIRHIKTRMGTGNQGVNIMHEITTTVVGPTTDIPGAAVSVKGWKSGVFLTRVIANASGSPAALVDGGMITSNYTTTLWGVLATIHPDFTTTANNYSTYVNGLPDIIRGRLSNTTTTSSVRFQISAKLFAL